MFWAFIMTYLPGINTPSLTYIIQNKPGLLLPQPEQTNTSETALVVKGGMFIKLRRAIPHAREIV